MRPLVSVIINNFNYGRFLGQAIRSVLNQDYPAESIELIVVDDGSTDDSPAVIESFGKSLRAVFQEHQGQAMALNRGLEIARGGMVCFLDSDDWWHREKIEQVMGRFSQDRSLGMVQHRMQEVNQEGKPRPHPFPTVSPTYHLADFLKGKTFFTGTSGLSFTAEAIRKLLPIPAELFFCADEYLYTHILFVASVGNLDEVLGFRRVHGQNQYARLHLHPGRLENHLKVRRILHRELDLRLKKQGVSLSPETARSARVEELQEELLLHRYRGEWEEAFRCLRQIREMLSGGYKLFKSTTLLLAIFSPWMYVKLYGGYSRLSWLATLRRKALPE
ncbi:MAG: glycosyltransferase family 2 protein [Elusimicrobia bacterium]|nr:glycosyltransferase family 2 protein [Elusimicrobiota bacterium]